MADIRSVQLHASKELDTKSVPVFFGIPCKKMKKAKSLL